jgi:hypothetical protein
MNLTGFDSLIRKGCGKIEKETGLHCRYVKTNKLHTLRSFDNLEVLEHIPDYFYSILISLNNKILFIEWIEVDNDLMPSYSKRINMCKRLQGRMLAFNKEDIKRLGLTKLLEG